MQDVADYEFRLKISERVRANFKFADFHFEFNFILWIINTLRLI